MSFLSQNDLQLLKELNVLYVEDELEIQEVFCKFFSKFCKNLISAYNGQDGYDKFLKLKKSDTPIDLIITDTNMPILSGIDMAKNIRDLSDDVPIIMITANDDSKTLKSAFTIGIVGYILKPIEMSELFENITRAMVVTRSKRYEQELKKLNETLEERVKIQQDQLVKQSRHAAMGEMISMIAHQWRQPLSTISSIISNIDIAIDLDDLDNQVLKDDLKKITNLTQYLSQTINDFRNFFLPTKNKDVSNLKVLTQEANNLLNHLLKIKDIELVNRCNLEANIEVYKNEFVQVLINIIKNAVDQFEHKKDENKLIIIESDQSKEYVILKISDNAGGVADGILPKIFEPYFSTKSEKNGTGLGLYMSKTIIEEHLQGKIIAYNNNIGGATFEIQLQKMRGEK